MADVLVKQDWVIIGFIVSAIIGIIIIAFCLLHFIKSTHNDTKMKTSMKYPALISFVSSFMYCIIIAVFRTSIIFNELNFNGKSVNCHLGFGFTYFFYIVARFGTYILFTYRLEIVFQNTPFAISNWFSRTIRLIIIMLSIVYIPGLCIFSNKQEIITSKYDISLCTLYTEFTPTYGNLSVFGFVVTDVIISGLLLFLYCHKLYKMSKILFNSDDDNMRRRVMMKLQTEGIKSCILVINAIISTWIIVFVGNFIWYPLGWFIPLDITINSATIYLMFGFSAEYYRRLCTPFICACNICIPDKVQGKAQSSELGQYILMKE